MPVAASGLRWEKVGVKRPKEGRELNCPGLADALVLSTELTQQEWDSFGIKDLRTDDFIRAANTYFRPVVAVWVSGVTGVNASKVNGTYLLIEEQQRGGRPAYKKEGADVWIEYFPASSRWQVKEEEWLGTDTCYMASVSKCQDTEAVEEVSCGWEVFDNAVNASWEKQNCAVILRYTRANVGNALSSRTPCETRYQHRVYETHVFPRSRPEKAPAINAKEPPRIELFFKSKTELRDRLRLLKQEGFSCFSISNTRDDDHAFPDAEASPEEAKSSLRPPPVSLTTPQSARSGKDTARSTGMQMALPESAPSTMLEWLQVCLDEVPGCSLCVHYALRYNMDSGGAGDTFARFTRFLSKLNTLDKSSDSQRVEVLLLSGPGPKAGRRTPLDSVTCLEKLAQEARGEQWPDVGVAFNPHYQDAAQVKAERARLQRKLATRRVKTVFLQFGTDPQRLEQSLEWLMQKVENQDDFSEGLTVVGSMLLPTKQLLAQTSCRGWEGTFLSEEYLSCTEQAEAITKQILAIYARYGVELLVEAPGVQSREDVDLLRSLLVSAPLRKLRNHELAAAADKMDTSPTAKDTIDNVSEREEMHVKEFKVEHDGSLSGGYEEGDRVQALVADDHSGVSIGDEGTVVGRCNSKCHDTAERVLVDFRKNKFFWAWVIQYSRVVQYVDAELICKEGAIQDRLMVIKSGKVRESKTKRMLKCPSHWGQGALRKALALDDSLQPLPSNMVAIGRVEMYVVPVIELFARDRLPWESCRQFLSDLEAVPKRVNFRAKDEICACESEQTQTAPHTIFVTELRTGKTMELEVEPQQDTVYILKRAIQAREGIFPDRQELLLAGKPLDDSRTLASYGIKKHAKMHWGLFRTDVKASMLKKRLHHLDLVTKPNFYFKQIRLVAKLHEVSFPRNHCCRRSILFVHAFGDVNGVHRHMRACSPTRRFSPPSKLNALR